MKFINNYKTYEMLNESPDHLNLNMIDVDEIEEIKYYDSDTNPFTFLSELDKEKDILGRNVPKYRKGVEVIDYKKLLIGRKRESHEEHKKQSMNRGEFISNYGRLWFDYKVISFWKLDKLDKNMVDRMIKEIENKLNINLDDWFLDIKFNQENISMIIPIKDFNDNINFNNIELKQAEEDYNIHLLSAKEKSIALLKTGYRSKNTKWKKYMKPFEGREVSYARK